MISSSTQNNLASALPKDRRATITRDMPPPALIVEIVSPGQESRDRLWRCAERNRNYRYKHTEYAARGITEYWIIDRATEKVTVCLWVNGKYEDTIYTGDTSLKSSVIPGFNLSASQILRFADN